MSKFESGHPDEGALLRYLDGESPSGEARQVERHLKVCWQCRAEAESLEKAIADCVEYRKSMLAKHLPDVPQPWADLDRELARIDAETREPWVSRLTRPWFAGARWRWAAAAVAAAALVVAIFVELRKTPSVQAAALLNKAVGIAGSQPKTAARVRIRTRNRQITRRGGAAGVSTVSEGGEESAAVVRALFVKARYDWDDPLSASSYKAWRDGLAQKRDQVETISDPDRPYEKQYLIHTATETGELARASLTLRATDLHPVEGRLEFRDHEWVEMTEIPEPSMSVPELSKHLEVPSRREEPSLPAATPGATASISDELQVMAALHEIWADLGDPVAVSRSEGRVLVSGVGVSPERQREIHGALDAMPAVKVQFSEPDAVGPAAPEEPGRAAAPPTSAATGSLQARLEQQAGGRAELERMSAQILDWSDAAMSRAYALRGLAQRFPASAELSMKPEDRRVLAGMGREHADAMLAHIRSIRNGLGPMLAPLAKPAEMRPAKTETEWQGAAEDVLRTARRVEVLLSAVLGTTSGASASPEQAGQLLSALAELETQIEGCERLLGHDAGR